MTKPSLIAADVAIDADDDLIYDVAAECGQIVQNVQHMRWFRVAVAEALAERAEEEQ